MLIDASTPNFLAITSGEVVLNKSLVMENPSCSRIVSVTPIAVPPSSCVFFEVKGSNLVRSTTRFIIPFFRNLSTFLTPRLLSFVIFYPCTFFSVAMSGYCVHLKGSI